MRVDLRQMDGRAPRCELGLCKNRSTISLGDATARSGMGRLLLCDDCADQIQALLEARKEHPHAGDLEIAPETNETPAETNDTQEEAIVEPTPVETLATGIDEQEAPLTMEKTRSELINIAVEKGLTFNPKITKTELLELLAVHG